MTDQMPREVSTQGKRALTFALQAAINHNQKNLKQLAIKKNPEKRTFAEKQAMKSDSSKNDKNK